jgi:hypothetical protein
MWCTAPMFHAAGRKVYQRGEGDFLALTPAEAEKAGLAAKAVDAFGFVPMRATLGDESGKPAAGFRVELNPAAPSGFVFRATDPRYKQIMPSCLKNLLAELGR